MTGENNNNNVKTPKHVLAFRELLSTELRFMAQMQKLTNSKPWFEQLLKDEPYKLEKLGGMFERAKELCDMGSPLLALLGNPPSTPEAIITTDNFAEKIANLYDIICQDPQQLFNIELQPKLALMAIRQSSNVSLLQKIKPIILEKKNDPAYFNDQAATFFMDVKGNPQCPMQFLESCNIEPVQRQTRYPMLLQEILKTTPETEQQARTHLDHLVNITQSLVKKSDQLNAPQNNCLNSPFLTKQYRSSLISNTPSSMAIKKTILSFSSEVAIKSPPLEERPSPIKADALELIANLLRLYDYYTNSTLAKLQKFPHNSKQGWKKEINQLATFATQSYQQINRAGLSDDAISDIKKTLLQRMKDISKDVQQKWFYGGNSRLAKTLLELQNYYAISPEYTPEPYDQTHKFPAQIFFCASPTIDIDKKLSLAHGYINRHIVSRTASPFMNYRIFIETNVWRKLFPTHKQKVNASQELVGSEGKLINWMKMPPAIGAQGSLEENLKNAITPPHFGSGSPFLKGKYCKAKQEAENYLEEIKPTRGNGLEYY